MTDLQWFVTYDPIQNAWIGTGKTFTIGEQIKRFHEREGDYKNLDEWRVFLRGFMFYKNQVWEELRAQSAEFDALVEKLHMKILYGKKKAEVAKLFDELAELADAINQPKEEQ
jgi:hypothetical protein